MAGSIAGLGGQLGGVQIGGKTTTIPYSTNPLKAPTTPSTPNAPAPPGSANDPNTNPNGQQIIPDAGVYGQETNAANEAYQQAVANALANRNALYNQYGLLDTGAVDPNNPYGQYQQMLSQQGSQLTADEENAAGRNLGGKGLAQQQASADKNQDAFQNKAFQDTVAGNESNYQMALSNATQAKNQAVAQAYTDAMNTALQNMIANMESGYYTNGGNDNGNNDNSGGNDNTTKDTSDALSRYLANNPGKITGQTTSKKKSTSIFNFK